MNLYNIGLSGLNAAQARMVTTGHNIANIDTAGYNRQQVLVSTAGATASGSGYYGRGVMVDTVLRQYNDFRFTQLVSAQTVGASLVSYGQQVAQVNNLMGDPNVGISPALQKFFDSVEAVASDPGTAASRQEMVGQANSLVSQINEANRFLADQRNNINNEVKTSVSQINSYVERIDQLNQQIMSAKATASDQPPNDLYDQRDQLVTELSQLIKVNVVKQDDTFNLTVGNGQVLLAAGRTFPLVAVSSAADPSRTVVAYTAPIGGDGDTVVVELDDRFVSGGSLGGLLKFRSESLDVVQNDLGRMAIGLGMAFNAQHTQGLDANGNAGGDFFSVPDSVGAMASSRNLGSGQIVANIDDIQGLTADDYEITYDGTLYTVTRSPGNSIAYSGDGTAPPMAFDGLELTLGGNPVAGDKWVLQPTRNGARDMALAIGDPSQIAAADADGGSTNNKNALLLAQLRTGKIMGNGTLNVNETYAQIVNKVGVQTQQNATESQSQVNLISQRLSAQQAVSGVNMQEEEIYLMRYQDQYQASARLIDVSTQMFDTLLGLQA